MTPYVATITTDKYAACYKDGGMVVVRLKDGASSTLTPSQTNEFHGYVFDNWRLHHVLTMEAYFEGLTFTKRKWIVVRPGRTVIEIHNAPIES